MAVEEGLGGSPRLRWKDREPWGMAVSWTDPLSLQFTRCPGEPCGWIKQKVVLAPSHHPG